MFNPYVLLGVAVLWAASCGSAYVYGHHAATNAAGAAHAGVLDAAIKLERENAVIDAAAAFEAAQGQQKTQVQFRDRVQTVERIVREKPTDCSTSADAYGGVLDAIRAANDAITTAPKHVPVPAATGTGKPAR